MHSNTMIPGGLMPKHPVHLLYATINVMSNLSYVYRGNILVTGDSG